MSFSSKLIIYLSEIRTHKELLLLKKPKSKSVPERKLKKIRERLMNLLLKRRLKKKLLIWHVSCNYKQKSRFSNIFNKKSLFKFIQHSQHWVFGVYPLDSLLFIG